MRHPAAALEEQLQAIGELKKTPPKHLRLQREQHHS
jgi:hypothetical protein